MKTSYPVVSLVEDKIEAQLELEKVALEQDTKQAKNLQ